MTPQIQFMQKFTLPSSGLLVEDRDRLAQFLSCGDAASLAERPSLLAWPDFVGLVNVRRQVATRIGYEIAGLEALEVVTRDRVSGPPVHVYSLTSNEHVITLFVDSTSGKAIGLMQVRNRRDAPTLGAEFGSIVG